jgi:hypothetical protein
MTPDKYDRSVYGITPPLEGENPAPSSQSQQSETSNNKADKLKAPTTSLDPENIHNVCLINSHIYILVLTNPLSFRRPRY